ncbi:DUF3737 family protein [Pokkaliibacter sp. CJK22405]|uniref:DUF3737 family protein n=1 Tax=Pokkaliibacter sp. CJK22405 TaxID=3384615 RepID=UPI003984856F
MNLIENTFFEGERACFAAHDTRFENVKFYPGESAIKHTRNVQASGCEFMGKYPFWHDENVLIENCLFTVYARAAIWYTRNLHMRNTRVEAPKMFREMDGLVLENVQLPNAEECCWNCRDVLFRNVSIQKGDYLLMNGQNIEAEHFSLQGNYSFQDARNVIIRNAHLDSKDAFWGSENVTVYDSVLDGEYLGWHSTNLRLVNCTIRGSQPLCYAKNLVMENCIMENTDLCFEYSTIDVDITSDIISIKNPEGGIIRANAIGHVILDEAFISPELTRVQLKASNAEAAVEANA